MCCSEARTSQGSPPQVRGKHKIPATEEEDKGITPAGAGKTLVTRCNDKVPMDHPRRCGENNSPQKSRFQPPGSPPQVRGKPNDETSISAHTGITPAGAGKTKLATNPADLRQDHPRRCGENSDITSQRSYKSGSPPQVRGKRAPTAVTVEGQGITPAGAGKTSIGFWGNLKI